MQTESTHCSFITLLIVQLTIVTQQRSAFTVKMIVIIVLIIVVVEMTAYNLY